MFDFGLCVIGDVFCFVLVCVVVVVCRFFFFFFFFGYSGLTKVTSWRACPSTVKVSSPIVIVAVHLSNHW